MVYMGNIYMGGYIHIQPYISGRALSGRLSLRGIAGNICRLDTSAGVDISRERVVPLSAAGQLSDHTPTLK